MALGRPVGQPGWWRAAITETLQAAEGRAHRRDPETGATGGPAGNAVLTAWTGLALLALFLAELVTLLDVHRLISWHVVVGTVLVPVALAKTGSTGWRILRYYRGNPAYTSAGPPPVLLRILGPAVVAATLGLLGSGLLLIALGPDSSRRTIVSALGQRVDWVTVHQGLFLVWAVVTGLHVLARLVPALRLSTGRSAGGRVAGTAPRVAVLVATGVVAAVSAGLVLSVAGAWRHDSFFRFDGVRGNRPGLEISH
jgi:hypothetical protein